MIEEAYCSFEIAKLLKEACFKKALEIFRRVGVFARKEQTALSRVVSNS